jgi:hypothetical protein
MEPPWPAAVAGLCVPWRKRRDSPILEGVEARQDIAGRGAPVAPRAEAGHGGGTRRNAHEAVQTSYPEATLARAVEGW